MEVPWHNEPVKMIPGIPKKLYYSEIGFQVFTADWLRKQYAMTGHKRFYRWHHSANERHGAKAGFYAKMMGQSKGFPDWCNLGLCVAIELKILGGTLSTEQEAWLRYLNSIGWQAEVVYSFNEFKDLILAI